MPISLMWEAAKPGKLALAHAGLVLGSESLVSPSLTFNQRVLIRGRGASQHPQLWPDLVNPLLLNLERGVVCRGVRERN